MTRTQTSWVVFTVAVALALSVMMFFTLKVLDYEKAWAQLEERAALEENVRLALWRMDWAAATLLNIKDIPTKPQTVHSEVQQSQAQAKVQEPERIQQKMADPELMQQGDDAIQTDSYIGYQNRNRISKSYQSQMSRSDYGQRAVLNNVVKPAEDWEKLAPELLSRIKDIFPDARLVPAGPEAAPEKVDTRRLASIPAKLLIKEDQKPSTPLAWNTPVRVSLMVAWASAIAAALALGLLLRGVIGLSERRAAFVSTVTHELRTPLTTFRMYSEMLATGMVETPEARKHYLDTLVVESDRLGHLIENVLAYARLERHLSPKEARVLSVRELLDRSVPGLQRRVTQGGHVLHVDVAPECEGLSCQVDTIAVHQVLLNLIDNACKYGRSDVVLMVRKTGDRLEMTVSDSGPGLDKAQVDRLFTAFSKSKDDAVPGIGLGLYLSRRLSCDLGGDLVYLPGGAGARFVFRLPVVGDFSRSH